MTVWDQEGVLRQCGIKKLHCENVGTGSWVVMMWDKKAGLRQSGIRKLGCDDVVSGGWVVTIWAAESDDYSD